MKKRKKWLNRWVIGNISEKIRIGRKFRCRDKSPSLRGRHLRLNVKKKPAKGVKKRLSKQLAPRCETTTSEPEIFQKKSENKIMHVQTGGKEKKARRRRRERKNKGLDKPTLKKIPIERLESQTKYKQGSMGLEGDRAFVSKENIGLRECSREKRRTKELAASSNVRRKR